MTGTPKKPKKAGKVKAEKAIKTAPKRAMAEPKAKPSFTTITEQDMQEFRQQTSERFSAEKLLNLDGVKIKLPLNIQLVFQTLIDTWGDRFTLYLENYARILTKDIRNRREDRQPQEIWPRYKLIENIKQAHGYATKLYHTFILQGWIGLALDYCCDWERGPRLNLDLSDQVTFDFRDLRVIIRELEQIHSIVTTQEAEFNEYLDTVPTLDRVFIAVVLYHTFPHKPAHALQIARAVRYEVTGVLPPNGWEKAYFSKLVQRDRDSLMTPNNSSEEFIMGLLRGTEEEDEEWLQHDCKPLFISNQ